MSKSNPEICDSILREAFDTSFDAILITDSTGKILNANRATVQRYGYTFAELKQLNLSDLTADRPESAASHNPNHASKSAPLLEGWHRCKDGSELPVEIVSQPMNLQGKDVIYYTVRDISRRKSSNLDLQKHTLESILAIEPGTVYIHDLIEQKAIYVNKHWLTNLGYSPEELHELIGNITRIIHPDDLAGISTHYQTWREAGNDQTQTLNYRAQDKQGRWHWFASTETPFKHDENGSLTQVLGIVHDVTERKNAEILLTNSNRLLEMIAIGIPLPKTLTSLVSAIEDQSPGMLGSILLLDEDGIHIRHGAAPNLPAEFIAAIDGQPIGPRAGSCGTAAYRKEAVFVKDITTDPLWENYKSAAIPHKLRACWSTPILDPQGRVLGTFAMYSRQPGLPDREQLRFIDTTTHIAAIAITRHGTEKALRDSEKRLVKAQHVAGMGFLEWDLQTNRIYCSDEIHRLYGINRDEEYTTPEFVAKLVHPDDLEYVQKNLGLAVRGEKEYDIDHRIKRPDGTVIWVHAQAELVHDTNQNKSVLLGTAVDITSRKLAESALRENESKLQLFIRYSPSAIAMFDNDMRYIAYTRRWITDYELTEKNLAGRSFYELFPDTPDNWKTAHRRSLAGEFGNCGKDPVQRADGDTDWIRWETHPWRRDNGQIGGIIIFSEVITDRVLTEAKLQRLTRLYAALSQCNQAIVRCKSEAELLPQICRDAVNFGGMKMAWIGLIDEDTGLVRPVASFGSGIEYLKGIEISIDADTPSGRGPTGKTIRENHPFWCQDFQNNPATAPWHELGKQFGWSASASLPLLRGGAVIGAFNLYADVMNAFDKEERDLLIEMSMDISFALDRFALEKEHNQTVEALRVNERHLRTIIETEPESVKIIDKDGKLVELNLAGLSILEVESLDKAREYNFQEFILPEYQDAFISLHKQVLSGETATLQFEIIGLNGTRRWLEIHAAPMHDSDNEITSLLGIARDITEQKQAEERIWYLANFDSLTGLPNRIQLADHFSYVLNLVKRNSGSLAVFFIDIDHFKDINDTLGHRIGDALLIEISKRIHMTLRDQDMASRQGGDEFIVVLPSCDEQGAAQVAQKIQQTLSEPFEIELYDLAVSASIGIAIFPVDGIDLETLSKSADTALYRAKHDGRNIYRFFTPEMQIRAERNMRLVTALRNALTSDQLQLHFQPQVSLSDQRIIGAEALLRWEHPDLGMVSPAEFIPIAEDSGLILPIGEWVLRTAVTQLKHWIDTGHQPIVIAVNLSAVQFRHPGLPELISNILDEAQIPPKYLELELTEGVTMRDPQQAIALMNNLHGLGVRMSIDDFGTGYSSLNYLKKFRIYKLKIDQSFVRDIDTDLEDKAIVTAIISLAKSLGLQTIAEGVETAEQLTYLSEQGCDESQGYYFSKPLPASGFEKFIPRLP